MEVNKVSCKFCFGIYFSYLKLNIIQFQSAFLLKGRFVDRNGCLHFIFWVFLLQIFFVPQFEKNSWKMLLHNLKHSIKWLTVLQVKWSDFTNRSLNLLNISFRVADFNSPIYSSVYLMCWQIVKTLKKIVL